MHYAWEQSFARIITNKRATTSHGWNPLMYNLLDDKELKKDGDSNPAKNPYEWCLISADLLTLHFDNAISGTLLDNIVSFKVWKQALDTSWNENMADYAQQWKQKFQSAQLWLLESVLTLEICLVIIRAAIAFHSYSSKMIIYLLLWRRWIQTSKWWLK